MDFMMVDAADYLDIGIRKKIPYWPIRKYHMEKLTVCLSLGFDFLPSPV